MQWRPPTTADALLREAHEQGYRFPARVRRLHRPDRLGDTDRLRRGHGRGPPRRRNAGRDERDRRLGGAPAALARRAPLAATLRRRRRRDREARDRRGARARQPDRARRRDALLLPRRQRPDRRGHAHAHGSQFTIVVQGRTPAGDGTSVPTTFCVAYWDGDGALSASEAYTDTYATSTACSSRRAARSSAPTVTASASAGSRSPSTLRSDRGRRREGAAARHCRRGARARRRGRRERPHRRGARAGRDGAGPPRPRAGRQRADGRDPEREPDRAR